MFETTFKYVWENPGEYEGTFDFEPLPTNLKNLIKKLVSSLIPTNILFGSKAHPIFMFWSGLVAKKGTKRNQAPLDSRAIDIYLEILTGKRYLRLAWICLGGKQRKSRAKCSPGHTPLEHPV